jgi:hypothetical protein
VSVTVTRPAEGAQARTVTRRRLTAGLGVRRTVQAGAVVHTGCTPSATRRRSPPGRPSAAMVSMSSPRLNAIRRPSGDQVGIASARMVSMCAGAPGMSAAPGRSCSTTPRPSRSHGKSSLLASRQMPEANGDVRAASLRSSRAPSHAVSTVERATTVRLPSGATVNRYGTKPAIGGVPGGAGGGAGVSSGTSSSVATRLPSGAICATTRVPRRGSAPPSISATVARATRTRRCSHLGPAA